jgi:hypothetical protein
MVKRDKRDNEMKENKRRVNIRKKWLAVESQQSFTLLVIKSNDITTKVTQNVK